MAERPSNHQWDRTIAAREHARLYAILDEDPARAIVTARQLTSSPDLSEANVRGIRASIYIDAGEQLSDAEAVAEGVALLREIDSPDSPQFAYNIGNGLAALAKIRGNGKLGELDTAELRQEARSLFQRAADKCEVRSIQSSSLTNQANLLKDSFRWVEAYDAYASALEHDPTNAVALSGISSLLRWRMTRRVDAEGPLRRAAVRYLLRAHAAIDQAHRYAGPQGVKRVEELVREFNIDVKTEKPQAEAPPVSAYAAFVRRHRLALCLEPESAGADAGRWDHLAIKSVSEAADGEWRIPTIFASWNVLKSDFLTARWLAHVAAAGDVPETGFYSDTLDYANYGSRYSALVLAQKAAFDVLDKIAVAATDYLRLPGNSQQIYFATRWHVLEPKRPRAIAVPLRWQPEIEAEIAAGNRSLIALAELAHDYATGYLRSKKELRNSATHRLVVVHEMLIDGHSRPSQIIERYGQAEFEDLLIGSLQVARAALLYFSEVVSVREQSRKHRKEGVAVPMIVPSHHSVRAEDSDDGHPEMPAGESSDE